MFVGIVRESTDGNISLINVPIVTPNCEIIVPNLTVHVSNYINIYENIYLLKYLLYTVIESLYSNILSQERHTIFIAFVMYS